MGSGEGDAVREITVNNTANTPIGNGITTTTAYPYDTYWGTGVSTWSYPYYITVYKYQIKCPVRACKTRNWLEIDKITPCTSCGAKLKAVSEQADFEVPVDK